jgi:hypothetical protein
MAMEADVDIKIYLGMDHQQCRPIKNVYQLLVADSTGGSIRNLRKAEQLRQPPLDVALRLVTLLPLPLIRLYSPLPTLSLSLSLSLMRSRFFSPFTRSFCVFPTIRSTRSIALMKPYVYLNDNQ